MAVAVTLFELFVVACVAYIVIKKAVKDALKEYHKEVNK